MGFKSAHTYTKDIVKDFVFLKDQVYTLFFSSDLNKSIKLSIIILYWDLLNI